MYISTNAFQQVQQRFVGRKHRGEFDIFLLSSFKDFETFFKSQFKSF